MLNNIFVSLMMKIVAFLFTKGLEYFHGQQKKSETEKNIDERLAKFKEAYKGAFDGEPVTPEQRAKLNQAIRDFIRGDGGGGL